MAIRLYRKRTQSLPRVEYFTRESERCLPLLSWEFVDLLATRDHRTLRVQLDT